MADALPEVSVSTFEPAELRQLRADQLQGDAGLEASHHRLGDELHDRAGAKSPRDQCRSRREQRRARSERGESVYVSARDPAKARSNQERDGGGDSYRRLPRAAKDPKDQAGE